MLLDREACTEQATPRREGNCSTCGSEGSAALRDSSDAGLSSLSCSGTDSTTPKSGCTKPLLRPSTPSLVAKDSHSLTFQWDRACLQESYLVELQQRERLEGAAAASNGQWCKVYCGEESWAQVRGLRPGRLYAVRVWREQGEEDGKTMSVSDVAMFRTTPARPSAPCAPLLAKKTQRALKLKWSEPHDLGGAQPIHYSLEIQCPSAGRSSSEGFFEVFNGQTKSFKVVGLVPGAKYCFRLRASNEVGESDWSRISHYTTKTQIPRIPKYLRVVDAYTMEPNKKAVNLEWACPDIDSVDSQPVWYLVELQDMKTMAMSSMHVCTPHAYIGGLSPRWRYSARIQASNKFGSSCWSDACYFKTSALCPGVPSELTVKDVSESTAKLIWGPPVLRSGSPVQSYLINVFEISNSFPSGAILRASYIVDQPGCRLSQLKDARKYEVQIRAIAREGYGPPAHIHFESRPSKPQRPSMPYADSRSAVALSMKWDTPECTTGEPILKYYLEMRRTDAVCGLMDIPDFEIAYEGTEPFTNLEGLEPGGVYALRVRAENAFGFSQWSDVAYESTKSHALQPPDPPTATKCTSSSIELEWDSSLIDNEIFELESCCLSGADASPVSESVYEGTGNIFELHNLSPGQEYQFQIRKKFPSGVTAWSEPLLARTLCDIPEAPDVVIRYQDSKNLTLQWKSSSLSSHSSENSFLLELGTQYGRKMKWEVVYEGTGLEWTLDGLSWQETHFVRVAERSAAGQGAFCTPISVKLHMPLPAKPKLLSFSQLKHASVRLQWSMPSTEQAGPAALYRVEAAEGDHGYHVVHQSRSSKHIVVALAAGEAYQFRVCAVNATGQGEYSEPLKLTAPLRSPKAPVEVNVSVQDFNPLLSKQRLQVSWKSANDERGFANPDYFVVQAASRSLASPTWNFQAASTLAQSTTECSCTLDGAHCGTEYAVRIRATGPEQKLGNWSDTIVLSVPPLEKMPEQISEVKPVPASWLDDTNQPISEGIPAFPGDSLKASTNKSFGHQKPDRADVRSVPREIVRSAPAGRPRPQKRKLSLARILKSRRGFAVCAITAVAAIMLVLFWMN